MIKVAILASGTGSNAENIINFSKEWKNKFEVAVVISDKTTAMAIARSQKLGIKSCAVPIERDKFSSQREAKKDQEEKIKEILQQEKVQWVFLAGYMRILSSDFLDSFYDSSLGLSRVVNIHPSLLPSFPGKNGYEKAYHSGVKISGVTVHFVDSGIDTGPPILQDCFPRFETDSLDEFINRGLNTEYRLYREAIKLLIEKRITLIPIKGSDKSIVHIERL